MRVGRVLSMSELDSYLYIWYHTGRTLAPVVYINLCSLHIPMKTMVAYFYHHLSDNHVDLSDYYVTFLNNVSRYVTYIIIYKY